MSKGIGDERYISVLLVLVIINSSFGSSDSFSQEKSFALPM